MRCAPTRPQEAKRQLEERQAAAAAAEAVRRGKSDAARKVRLAQLRVYPAPAGG